MKSGLLLYEHNGEIVLDNNQPGLMNPLAFIFEMYSSILPGNYDDSGVSVEKSTDKWNATKESGMGYRWSQVWKRASAPDGHELRNTMWREKGPQEPPEPWLCLKQECFVDKPSVRNSDRAFSKPPSSLTPLLTPAPWHRRSNPTPQRMSALSLG